MTKSQPYVRYGPTTCMLMVRNQRRKFKAQCIYLFGVLCRFQQCTGHITTGSWKGRGNQYIQFVRVLYCKLLTNGKQLPAFPLEAVPGTEPRPQRWEVRVLPLCHRGPLKHSVIHGKTFFYKQYFIEAKKKKLFE